MRLTEDVESREDWGTIKFKKKISGQLEMAGRQGRGALQWFLNIATLAQPGTSQGAGGRLTFQL